MNIYFDIETTGFDKVKDNIITIQYQEINSNGIPKSDLVILKEWESSEEEIVKKIYNELIKKGDWNWVLVGTNLIFDLTFLWAKFNKYNFEVVLLSEFLYSHPIIDIKYMLVMMNNLSFKGAGLDQMTNKKTDGRMIPQFYMRKEYKQIELYIEDETNAFLEFFQKCMQQLPKLIK